MAVMHLESCDVMLACGHCDAAGGWFGIGSGLLWDLLEMIRDGLGGLCMFWGSVWGGWAWGQDVRGMVLADGLVCFRWWVCVIEGISFLVCRWYGGCSRFRMVKS